MGDKEKRAALIEKSRVKGWNSLSEQEVRFLENFANQSGPNQEGFESWEVAQADIENQIGKDLLGLANKAWNDSWGNEQDPEMKYNWFSDWYENYKAGNIQSTGEYKPYEPDVVKDKGNEAVVKNIFSFLKDEELLNDNEIAFDDWLLGIGPKEKFAIHRLLKEQGLTESDYNTWQQNSFGVIEDVEVNPNDIIIEEAYDENPEEWMGLPLNKKGLITATVLNKDNEYTFSDNQRWNETVNKALKAGTHAFDPETGSLIKLEHSVDAADQDVVLNTEPTMASDNFQQERLRVNDQIDNIYNNPPLDSNGNVDVEALNAEIAAIDDRSTFLTFDEGNLDEELSIIKQNNLDDITKFFDTYQALALSKGQRGYLDAQKKLEGIEVEGDDFREKQLNYLKQNEDFLWKIAEQNGVSREDFDEYFNDTRSRFKKALTGKKAITSGGRDRLTKKLGGSLEDLILDAIEKKGYTEQDVANFEKEKEENRLLFEQWKNGDIELSTSELSKISTITEGAKAYARTFMPEVNEITDPGKAYKTTLNKLVASDPQFQTIQNNITSQLQEDSKAYIDSIRNKYNVYSQSGLEFLQEDIKKWWNDSYNKAIQSDPEATKLFQEYAASLNANFSDYIRDYDRSKDAGLSWVDEQFKYYGERGEGSDSWAAAWNRGRAQIYEMTRKLPGSTDLRLITKPLAAWANSEIQDRKDILNYLDGLDDNMTLGEARKDNDELDQFLTFNDWVWTDGDTVGDYRDRKEMRLENSEDRARDIFTDMIQLQADEMIFKQHDNEAAFGLTDGFSLEGFMQMMAQGVDQLPHLLPSMVGGAVGAAGVATGNPILIKLGIGLAAASAGIQGAMAYGETFMEATERFINDNPDYAGKRLTGEDYVEILKSSEYNVDSGLFSYPAMAGLSVMGSEFISDVIGQKIGGGAAKWVFKSPLTTKLMSNTFTNYLLKAGYGVTAMEAGSAKEYLTEGFQSYLEQGFANATAGQSSPFTTNISLDDILMEARMGKKMGYLFGGGTAIGGIAGSSTDINSILVGSYNDRAIEIANNIDMTKGSKTFVASEAAFMDLQNDILNDPSLSDDQKQNSIIELNDTRNAALKIPADIKGDNKVKLIALLKEKANLNRRIKAVDDSDISAPDIRRRAEVSKEIQNIVEGRVVDAELDLDENISNVRNIIQKTSKGKITIDEVANAKEANAFAKREKLQGWKTKYSSNQGTILQNPNTGEQKIIINREQAIKDQAVNVAGHEFLHGLLLETVKNSPETSINLGNALDEHLASLNDIDIDQVKNSKYKENLKKYRNEPESFSAEEKLTLFSDALKTGDIKFDEDIATRIGDAIRRFLQSLGVKIKFNKGRDVYNFIKDFNNSIAKGELNIAQESLLERSAEGDLIADEVIDTDTKAKGSIADVNKRFAEKTWAEDLKKSKDNIDTQFGAGTVATIKPNTKWETFKKRQIEKGIDWDGQIAANDETRMQRDFEAVQRDLKEQQKEAKGKEYRKTLKGLERIDQELVAISGMVDEGWWDKTDPRYKQHNDLRRRRKKIQKLEIENDANELRAKLKKATGENRENIEIALEEKFKKLPQAVKDAGIDIYTGKPVDEVTAKAAKGETVKKSKKLTDLIKEYKEGNFENVEDLAIQYQKVGKDAVKRWAAQRGVPINLGDPQVDKEVTSLLNKEFDSFVRNFDPEVSEASTYMNQIAKRVGTKIVEEAARKDKQVSQDVLTEKGVSPKTTEQKDFDSASRKDTSRKKKYVSSIPAVKNQITENVAKDLVGGVDADGRVTGLAKDIISNIGRNTDPESVAKGIIANTKDKSVMQTMRELIGKWGSPEYNSFVDNIIDQGLIAAIPVATIKRRLGRQSNIDSGLINYKKIGKVDQIKVKDGKKTYSRPDVYSITKLDKEKLKEYYKETEKRQQSLFSMLTEGVLAEGLQTLRNDKAFMDRLRTALELKKSPLTAEEFMDGLEQKLDQRTKEDTSLDEVTVKSSKAWTGGDQQSFEDKMGYVPVGRDWLEELALDKGKPSWWYKMSVKENRERLRRIEDLETQYSADELRDRIEKAKGEAKTDLILALEMKFEKFPELVEDSGIDIYTGKPSDKVIAKSAKGDKTTNFQKVSYNSRNLDIAARKDSQDFLDPEKGLKKLGTEQQFDKGKTPSQRHLRLTNREKGIRDEYIKRNFKALGPNAITSNTFIDYRTGVFANMEEVYAAIGNGNKKEGERIVAAEEARYNKEAQKLVKTKESIKRFKEGKPVKQKRGIDIVYLNKDGKVIKSVLKTAQIEQKQYGKAPIKGGWNLATWYRNIRNPEWRELQKDKLKVLKNLALIAEADIKANPENVVGWEAFLSSQANKGTHPIRALAPISFFTRIMQGAQVAEHTLPANQVSTMILEMAMKGNVNKDFDGSIGKNYMQGKITKRMDDAVDVIPEGQNKSLKVDMPNAFFNMLNPVTWIRYVEKSVNARKGGLNLNTVIVWDNDGNTQTLTEYYGVGLTPAQYNMPKGSRRAGRMNQNLIQEQNNFIFDMFVKGEPTAEVAKERLTAKWNLKVQRTKTDIVAKNSKSFGDQIFDEDGTSTAQKETMLNSLETRVLASKPNRPAKGISIFDFDDTLAKTKEKVIVTMSDGRVKEISASEFAKTADILVEGGASFDFSNFEKVAKGTKKGPLADIALKRQGKFGSGDIFVLTARPQSAAPAIKQFLDSIGLDIPIENITGLADGTAQAKVNFVLNKTAEGYNDFYFADDSIPNVKAVKEILNEIDIKSDTVIAKASKQDSLNKDFEKQIEEVTGVESFKKYSTVRAKLEGKKKDAGFLKRLRRQFTITSSAEDFLGLLYPIIGKGEQGNKHRKFIDDNLIDPYNKAEQELMSAQMSIARDFENLKKQFPSLKSTGLSNPLMDEIGVGPYTKSQAIRVYMWNKQGMDIPGMSKRDINALVKAVESNNELNVFADEVMLITKSDGYPAPSDNWLAGGIADDIVSELKNGLRPKLLAEFNTNVEKIFTPDTMNKLEAIYGSKWREAFEDSLRRMKSGSNRPVYVGGGARIVNEMLDWLNKAVGTMMFFNVRSGTLQLLSNVNFINWGDNNIYNAAKAFGSKEYWPTVLKLLNSDYLVNRRDGLKINVNEAELADAGRKGGFKGMLSYLLDKGFVITRIMDSVAIATGGATFFINRQKALLNRTNPETGKKYTKAEAEAKAFDDFYAISEETQQSSNPSKISQQQASLFGRTILAFQNVTMQYNRKAKKMLLDLINRRKRPGMTQRESDLSNVSGIMYYTTVQNLVFNSMQQALFALMFDDATDEEEKEKTAGIINGMLDSLLFGLGFGGAIVSTVKNVGLKIFTEAQRKSPDYEEAVWEVFNVSPVIDSKVRKLRSAARTFNWNMDKVKSRGWSIENPAYLAVAQVLSAGFNLPIDRVLQKYNNMAQAMDEETRVWQKIALIMGYSGWNFDLPYWGTQSHLLAEQAEIEEMKQDYKYNAKKLKAQGYKRVPLTGPKAGKPDGKLNEDYIEVERWDGVIEYWINLNK